LLAFQIPPHLYQAKSAVDMLVKLIVDIGAFAISALRKKRPGNKKAIFSRLKQLSPQRRQGPINI